MIKPALLATVLAAAAAHAAAAAPSTVSVKFHAYLPQGSGSLLYRGRFKGVDANHDGILSLDELTAFEANPVDDATQHGRPALTLATLRGFGSDRIASNEWIADAADASAGAYFVDAGSSPFDAKAWIMSTQAHSSAVPEPATWAMTTLALFIFLATRRRSSR